MDLSYSKRDTNFLFCSWLLTHKSLIAGWIAAESDSEIVLRTVVGIYTCDWDGATAELDGATAELDGARSGNVMQSQ